MTLHKYLFIIVLIVCIIAAGTPSNVYADAAPASSGGWAILPAIGAIILFVITIGIYLLIRHYRHATKEPVTAISFDAEDVSIAIEKGEMKVDASFEYRNTSEKKLQMDLYFPFSQLIKDSISELSIELVDAGTKSERQLKYKSEGSRIYFDFIIEPKERKLLKIHYRETNPGTHAEYILTTINKWQRPVAKATFTVELPSDFVDPKFSFGESLVEKISPEGSSHTLYRFAMHDLFPKKEFQIDWQ